nr:hypothetical protein [Micromonospora sp. NBRC 107566]
MVDVRVLLLDTGDGAPRLVAAYTGAPEVAADLTALARAQLPAYMLPGRIRWFARLPLASSGKVDRRGLIRMLADRDAAPAGGDR